MQATAIIAINVFHMLQHRFEEGEHTIWYPQAEEKNEQLATQNTGTEVLSQNKNKFTS